MYCSSACWPLARAPGLGRTPLSPLSFGQAYTSPPSPSEPTTAAVNVGEAPEAPVFSCCPQMLWRDRVETQTGCVQVDPASSPSPLASVIVACPCCFSVPSDLSSSLSPGSLTYRFTLVASLLHLTRACLACFPSPPSDSLGGGLCPKVAGLGGTQSGAEMTSSPSSI